MKIKNNIYVKFILFKMKYFFIFSKFLKIYFKQIYYNLFLYFNILFSFFFSYLTQYYINS